MKTRLFVVLMFAVTLLPGCHILGLGLGDTRDNFSVPTLVYEELGGSWLLATRRPDEWTKGFQEDDFPEGFSKEQRARLGRGLYDEFGTNYFFAQIKLPDGTDLVLKLGFEGAYEKRQYRTQVWFDTLWIAGAVHYSREHDYFYQSYTSAYYVSRRDSWATRQPVKMAANPVNVDFDNASLYFLREGQKVEGEECYMGASIPPHSVHNLSEKQNIPAEYNDSWQSPCFLYLFPMTREDLDGAILVIDGLSQNGKTIPPLKVRLSYYNLEEARHWPESAPPDGAATMRREEGAGQSSEAAAP